MDNSVIRSAMVTQHLNKTLIVDQASAIQFHTDYATTTLAERASFNVDRRTVAIGGSEEFWMTDLFKEPSLEWGAMIRSMNDSIELMLQVKNPTNLLYMSPGPVTSAYVWANAHPSANLTLMNSYQLDAYEQHQVTISSEYAASEYDVINYSDLEAGVEDKFDFIMSMPWDIVSDPEVQKWCVDALAPGGILMVALTNNGTKLYKDDFHTHPYHAMHEFFHSCNGYTYHNTGHYGYTVFVKN